VLISFLVFWLWGIIVNKIHKADIGLNPWCSSLKKYIDEHFLAFELGGFLVLLSGSIFVLMMTWGLIVQNVFRSDIPFVRTFTHVLSISLLTILIIQILRYVINKFKVGAESRMIQSGNSNALEVNKRVETLGSVVQKISISGIVLMAVIMIMDELGFDIKAMLAGVGILGLAVGFGAQNLVRDIISGLFLIFENRIRVGDVAIVNGTGGYVEQVNLRTSVLRGADGTVHVFPNGSISSLSNMTFEYSFYVFDIGVSYKENTDRVIEVLKGVGEKLLLDPLYKDAILEPMEIMGVDAFKDSAVIIKARIKTLPIKQWVVGREMNRRIKMRFEELGIEIPFPQQSINFSNTNKPLSLKLEGGLPQKDELKDLIREVLLEQDEEKHV
jgi:small conductance mechanosensitive channel